MDDFEKINLLLDSGYAVSGISASSFGQTTLSFVFKGTGNAFMGQSCSFETDDPESISLALSAK